MDSLVNNLPAWEALPASRWALGTIRSGFRLLWGPRRPPLRFSPPTFRPPGSAERAAVLREEVAALVKKGAVEVVTSPSPGFYGHLFCVPKVSGGWRPVLDLSALNQFLLEVPFKMETAASIREAVRPGDWGASLDLTDAYFHVPIAKADRKWLRFVWEDQIFQFRALPFGLSLAPWVFTMIARELGKVLRSMGIRIRMYLDDWLVLADSQERCGRHMKTLLSATSHLGFLTNLDKSDLTPSQRFCFLGMEFNTVSFTVAPVQRRVDRLLSCLSAMSGVSHASARQLAALLGTLESLAPLVPLGRLHKRELQRCVRERWNPSSLPWDYLIELGPWWTAVVHQWSNVQWLLKGVPISLPPPSVHLFTDASMQGWGAHLGAQVTSGLWDPMQQGLHINLLEMEAVRLALLAFLPALRGSHVLLRTDNTSVACYLNKQGGVRSPSLSRAAENILLWAQKWDISLTAQHVPGCLNVIADGLSRRGVVRHTEWTLAKEVLEPIWSLWFRPMVDLFATRFNHRLPIYVSPVRDDGAWAVDALAIPWSNLLGYAFPPFAILAKVILKARLEAARLILIAPWWPTQPWFPELMSLSHVPAVPLVLGPRSLLQPRTGVPHGNPQGLRLHAWMLCGAHCLHEVHPPLF